MRFLKFLRYDFNTIIFSSSTISYRSFNIKWTVPRYVLQMIQISVFHKRAASNEYAYTDIIRI
jgi:hypothetical protein